MLFKKIEIKLLLFLSGILVLSLGILLINDYLIVNTKNNVESDEYDTKEEVQTEETIIESGNILKIDNTEIKIELALSNQERMQGLSDRESLADDSGMFFVFDNPGLHGIWMNDMNFPIDIIWFDENFKIVDIRKSVGPETFPETFYPQSNSLYVLEVNSGFSEKHGFGIGSYAEFLENSSF